LAVVNSFEINNAASICEGDSILLAGNYQYSAGEYIDTLISTAGCDSIITTTLTVVTGFEIENSVAICEGDSILLGGEYQMFGGVFQDSLQSILGCDSIVTTTLTVNPNEETNIPVSICEGESYFAAGANQTTTGIYFDILNTIFGCDSIVITDLTVLPNSMTNLQEEICESDFYMFAGNQLTQSGTYTDTLVAVNGCDSIVTLELNVLPESVGQIQATVCEGTGFIFGNETYFEDGVYQETFTSSNGCDSLVTLNLTVTNEIIEETDATICSYESIEFGNEVLTESGLYSDTLTAVGGCDSIVNLDLTVLFPAEETVNATICIGDSYTLGNMSYQTPGIYQQDFIATSGCDSLVTLNLSVVPNFQLPISATLCANDYFQVGDSLYNQSGLYYVEFECSSN